QPKIMQIRPSLITGPSWMRGCSTISESSAAAQSEAMPLTLISSWSMSPPPGEELEPVRRADAVEQARGKVAAEEPAKERAGALQLGRAEAEVLVDDWRCVAGDEGARDDVEHALRPACAGSPVQGDDGPGGAGEPGRAQEGVQGVRHRHRPCPRSAQGRLRRCRN